MVLFCEQAQPYLYTIAKLLPCFLHVLLVQHSSLSPGVDDIHGGVVVAPCCCSSPRAGRSMRRQRAGAGGAQQHEDACSMVVSSHHGSAECVMGGAMVLQIFRFLA